MDLKNSLPKAITSGVAKCFHSIKNYGPLDNHVIFSKPPAFNGFGLSLPRAVCSWTSQLLMDPINILVSGLQIMDFPLPLPQAIILRASQLFYFLGYGELRYHTIFGKL